MNEDISVIRNKLISSKELNKINDNLNKSECTKKTKKVQSLLTDLYNKIVEGILWTNQEINSGNIIFYVEKISNIKDLPVPEIFNDHFYPKSLREDMKNRAEINIITSFKINNITFKINLITELVKNKNLDLQLKYLFENIKCMISWIKIAIGMSQCSKTVNEIKIYFYKFKNNKIITKDDILLKPININSAYANVCSGHHKNLEMIIFRDEEWFKVLIHETFHIFNLTISPYAYEGLNKVLKGKFGLNIDYNIGECYADFWARIINILYSILDNHMINKKDFFKEFEKRLELERTFSVIQAIKMLKFNNLLVEYFYENNRQLEDGLLVKQMYREETSIFSYYVLSSLMLICSTKVFNWCYENNNNICEVTNKYEKNVEFIELLNKILNNEDVKDYIKKIEMYVNKSSNKILKNNKSTRMSINEWIN